jgi:hypothetical protein
VKHTLITWSLVALMLILPSSVLAVRYALGEPQAVWLVGLIGRLF